MTYSYDVYDATKQIAKYRDALMKCLRAMEPKSTPHIETVLIVGPDAFDGTSPEQIEKSLESVDARMVRYDQLIENAERSYSDYLEANKEASKIRSIVDKLI